MAARLPWQDQAAPNRILAGSSASSAAGEFADPLVQHVQFTQSFARRSAHNNSHIVKLTEAITGKNEPSFVEVMWMLKER